MPTRYKPSSKSPEARIGKALTDAADKINAEANAEPKKDTTTMSELKAVAEANRKSHMLKNDSNNYHIRREAFLNFATKARCVIAIKSNTKGGDVVENFYITSSGWQFIAEIFGYNLTVKTKVAFHDQSVDFFVVESTVILTDESGKEVSRGTMIADTSEEWLKDKPRYAAYGLAQTRAISRAVRNKLGWFAEYCGFSATPYEEMPHK